MQDQDNGIMEVLYSLGYKRKELIMINRVRNYMQVIYLSDVM